MLALSASLNLRAVYCGGSNHPSQEEWSIGLAPVIDNLTAAGVPQETRAVQLSRPQLVSFQDLNEKLLYSKSAGGKTKR